MTPKKIKIFFSKILGIIGLVLVILIIGVGALLAGRAWNPSWNPFKEQKKPLQSPTAPK